jgi:hypothetical protein
MKALRIIGTVLAAALCSAALSVGAALAEGPAPEAAGKAPAAQKPAAGVCFLHDL